MNDADLVKSIRDALNKTTTTWSVDSSNALAGQTLATGKRGSSEVKIPISDNAVNRTPEVTQFF